MGEKTGFFQFEIHHEIYIPFIGRCYFIRLAEDEQFIGLFAYVYLEEARNFRNIKIF